MKKVLIIGGGSGIARFVAKCFARDGASLYLADLKLERLQTVKADILTHYPTEIFIEELDVNDFSRHEEVIQSAFDAMKGIDAVLIAHGTLPNQAAIEADFSKIHKELSTNAISVISLATNVVNLFEKQNHGTLAAISSVAGDRGRASNYVYGTAKGAVSLYFQGLRGRVSNKPINIITIKPGFVDTPMTANAKKNPLYSSAEAVGKAIYNAMKSGKEIVYVPGYWRLIMLVVKMIPENIFKKLKF